MRAPSTANNIPELYPIRVVQDDSGTSLATPAMRHIAAARDALDILEAGLPGGPDRWQADGLLTAREGLRRAWLTLANLDRRLKKDCGQQPG